MKDAWSNIKFYGRCIKIVFREWWHRLFPVVAICICCGCANIITRTDCDSWATAPYQCTCEVAEAIAAPFSRPSGPEGGIAQAICTVILPISIISLPFDAAIDTVFLPWDLYCRKEAK